MTGRELVTAALKKLGVIAPGESLASAEAVDALAELNRMISSWSNESLLIHAVVRETPLTLTVSDATYTMGTAGSFTNRPQSIDSALIRDETSSPAVEYPVRLLTLDEYTAIPAKDSEADYPTDLYDDGGYPLRTLTLYPVPSAAHKLVLFTKRILTEIATLDTSLSVPPGYEDAMVYGLAIRLAPEYGKTVSQEVALIATESKANIKRANMKTPLMRVDPAISTGIGRSNIFTGGS